MNFQKMDFINRSKSNLQGSKGPKQVKLGCFATCCQFSQKQSD